MNQTRPNPFVPGRGALPPYLAGREAEQRALMAILGYVEAGRGAPRDVVLCGPPGNGKTVLLRWLQRQIAERDNQIDLLWRTPSDLPSVDALATTLVPPRRFRSMLPDTLSLSVDVGRAGWDLGNNASTLAELLTVRCGQRPLVVLLDEAHTLDPGRSGLRLESARRGRCLASGHSQPHAAHWNGGDVKERQRSREAPPLKAR